MYISCLIVMVKGWKKGEIIEHTYLRKYYQQDLRRNAHLPNCVRKVW